jgi:hypothetical protein
MTRRRIDKLKVWHEKMEQKSEWLFVEIGKQVRKWILIWNRPV